MTVQPLQSGCRQQLLELASMIPAFTSKREAFNCMGSVVLHACARSHVM